MADGHTDSGGLVVLGQVRYLGPDLSGIVTDRPDVVITREVGRLLESVHEAGGERVDWTTLRIRVEPDDQPGAGRDWARLAVAVTARREGGPRG